MAPEDAVSSLLSALLNIYVDLLKLTFSLTVHLIKHLSSEEWRPWVVACVVGLISFQCIGSCCGGRRKTMEAPGSGGAGFPRDEVEEDPRVDHENSSNEGSRWTRPPRGVLKLNFDGSRSEDGSSGWGFVIRDHFGAPLSLKAGNCNDLSIIEVEALGLFHGLDECNKLGLSRIQIEGDNRSVIDAMNKVSRVPRTIECTTTQCHYLANKCGEVTFTYI